jgi:hypothetical protein
MSSLKIILTLVLFSFLLSCDPGSAIKYEIENKTTEPIKAEYQFVFNASGDTSSQEMTIPANSNKIINEETPLGYMTHYDERHDSISLYWMTIQQGSKTARHNFKDKKYWTSKRKMNKTQRIN